MTIELAMYQVDAFAEAPFGGNPAAVVPLQEWLDDDLMQSIAMENNLAETAFFVRLRDDPDADYHLRWFTPAFEIDLCGHATLASAAILFDQLRFEGARIRFRTMSGILTVDNTGDCLEMDFPARLGDAIQVPDGFVRAHGVEPTQFSRPVFNMAVLDSERAVREFKPDLSYIEDQQGFGLIVTGPGEDCDVVSRFFAPEAGIPEDPVTGSAHCAIVPYWAERLGKDALHCRQVSPRSGDLFCRLVGDRVKIAGRTRLFLEGRILV